MNRFIRWYNQNRKKVWKYIAIVVIFIGLIQLINYFYKKQNEKELRNADTQSITNTTMINNNLNSVRVDHANSSLTGKPISEGQRTEVGIIDNFISFCNNGNLQEAYDLLTQECKEEMYPSIENFQESYYNQIFGNGRKNVSVENWIDNIYKVNMNEDFLSTGNYSKENTIQDHITVVEKDGQYQLNINGYIGREEIKKSKEQDNITIEVQEEDSYMDYQKYKIKITNNSDNTIVLDDGVNIEAMYIEDDNGIQYAAYTHELSKAQLTINPRETRELEIKYYCRYGSEKQIDKLVFSRMILDNETYVTLQNKSFYNRYANFEIGI